MRAAKPLDLAQRPGLAGDPQVGEVAELPEVVEGALAQRRSLRRAEESVAVEVVLLDHERAEELVERPAMAQANELPPLEDEGRDVRDPDMGMGGDRPRRHAPNQHRRGGRHQGGGPHPGRH